MTLFIKELSNVSVDLFCSDVYCVIIVQVQSLAMYDLQLDCSFEKHTKVLAFAEGSV